MDSGLWTLSGDLHHADTLASSGGAGLMPPPQRLWPAADTDLVAASVPSMMLCVKGRHRIRRAKSATRTVEARALSPLPPPQKEVHRRYAGHTVHIQTVPYSD